MKFCTTYGKGEGTDIQEVGNRYADVCFFPKPASIVRKKQTKKKNCKSPKGQQMGEETQVAEM